MVQFLSKPSKNATQGERFFYNRLDQVFADKDDIIVYFEPDIIGLHPDVLILSPKIGIVIVEIKDYTEQFLKNAPKTGGWEYIQDEKVITISNPFDQMYQYWRSVKNLLEHCQFPENINIPITRIVGFSQVTEDSTFATEIKKVTPQKIILCFKESFNRNEHFKALLNDVLPLDFRLEEKYFTLLRANLIPSCRLPTLDQASLKKYFSPEDQIQLLDKEQERFARKLGDGHRLIFGVAGSGKTVILLARARFLALRHPKWKILVLCFNRNLRNYLFQVLNPQDFDADITVSTFHAWARQYILSAQNNYSQLYKEASTKAERENKQPEFFKDFVPKLFLQLLKDLNEKKVVYDAILIDEAQDFEADWFRVITSVLNPKTNSLLITCDGIQGIYAHKRFYWINVGIQAKGRVKRFVKSYRTPENIGLLAQKTLPKNLRNLIGKFDEFLMTKEYASNHGDVEIIVSDTQEEEYKALAEKVSRLIQKPQEIIILFRYNYARKNYDHPFFRSLEELNIEWKDLNNHNFENPGLLVGTFHGSKGLEADVIIIPDLNKYTSQKDKQLLYVGMTRSKQKLILTASESNLLIRTLKLCQAFDE